VVRFAVQYSLLRLINVAYTLRADTITQVIITVHNRPWHNYHAPIANLRNSGNNNNNNNGRCECERRAGTGQVGGSAGQSAAGVA